MRPLTSVVVPEFEQVLVPPRVGEDHLLLGIVFSNGGTNRRDGALDCLTVG